MKRPDAPTLATRLILLGALSALLITTGGGWLLRQNLHAVVLRSFEQGLNERADRIGAELQAAASGSLPPAAGRSAGGDFERIFSGWYWQLDGTTDPLRSRSLWDSALDLGALRPVAGQTPLRQTLGPRGEALMGASRPLVLGPHGATLHVFGPARETAQELERIDRLLLGVQAVFVLVFLLLTVLQARLGLAPMRRLLTRLRQVHRGEHSQVGRGFGPDLDPLAAGMDEVLARNAQIVERSRHHAANLSHALKKPLALLGAQAHGPSVASEQVQTQVQAMASLIDRHLARSASGAGDVRWIAVDERLQGIVALMRHLHAARQLQWSADVAAGLRWKGEPTDLEEMAGNLLDNAGKWAATRVRLTVRALDPGLELTVEDDGPGLQAHEIQQAARRGQRFDESVEGSGLGLAIVGDIADTYGGHLALDASPLGGLRCTLRLA